MRNAAVALSLLILTAPAFAAVPEHIRDTLVEVAQWVATVAAMAFLIVLLIDGFRYMRDAIWPRYSYRETSLTFKPSSTSYKPSDRGRGGYDFH